VAKLDYPTGRRGKIIGTPYVGTHSLGNWQSDNAVDISVPAGTPLIAVENGRVVKVVRHPQNGGRFAGDQITVQGESGNSYFYAHGSTTAVTAGQQIKAGQIIGRSGSANGVPHLHFGVQNGDPRQVVSSGRVVSSGDKSLLDKAITAGGGVLGGVLTGGKTDEVVKDAAGAAAGAATGAAEAAAKAGFGFIWDAISDEAAKAALYVLLVGGGIFLVVIGAARATGVKPSSAAAGAMTVIPQARAARLIGGAGAARAAAGAAV